MNFFTKLDFKLRNFLENRYVNLILIIFSSIYVIIHLGYLMIGIDIFEIFENPIFQLILIIFFLLIFLYDKRSKVSLINKLSSEITKYFFFTFLFGIAFYISVMYNYNPNISFIIIYKEFLEYSLLILLILYLIKFVIKKSFEKHIFHRFEIIQDDMEEIKNGNLSKRLRVFGVDEIDRMFYFTNDLLDELENKINFEKQHSILDPLTLCFNRRGLRLNFNNIKNKAIRDNDKISLIILDLDDFKKVNDQYGHSVGDKVLTEFCNAIRSSLRPYDSLYRLGGEEFLIIIPTLNVNNIEKIIGRIKISVKEVIKKKVPEIKKEITFSGGCSNSDDFDLRKSGVLDEMIANADKLLYKVKKSGKNKVQFQ